MHTFSNKPSKMAVALSYDGDSTPTIAAKGVGELAEKIIDIAQKHGVLIKEDPALIAYLSKLQLSQDIPEVLYRAVAEVIAFAYFINGKFPKDWQDDQER